MTPYPADLNSIKGLEAEVLAQYRAAGSKLRNTVRTKNNIAGASTTFQKIGKGTASTKARHGKVPVRNIDHTPIECLLSDHYAGDWVDKPDELKINIDEMKITAKSGAYALGRKTDEMIIAQMMGAGNVIGEGSAVGLEKFKVLKAYEQLWMDDVPDDGQRFAVVGWKQWSDMLKIEEFSRADYVDDDDLPWKGTQAKRWLGTLWIPHSGLPKNGNTRSCFWYHKTAVGHAIGPEVKTDITWHGYRDAYFVNNMMAQGACLIDPGGVVIMQCLET